jgi:hypothetical protein
MSRDKFIEKTKTALNFKKDYLSKMQKEMSKEEIKKETEIIDYLENVLKHIDNTVADETLLDKREEIDKNIQKWKAEGFGTSLETEYAITIREKLIKYKAQFELIDKLICRKR